jgi:glycosyltransferase involved in cell wall biosynthesis
MILSILTSCYNKGYCIEKVLSSIFNQKPIFDYEVIIVDDGSSDNSCEIISKFPVNLISLNKKESCGNPAKALNIGAKQIKGKILVLQSCDVEHISTNSLNILSNIEDSYFNIATVKNIDSNRNIIHEYTGVKSQGSLFFLGSLRTSDFIKIGGFSEEFDQPGSEDVWFKWCLSIGLKLNTKWVDCLGYHHDHQRPSNTNSSKMIELVNNMNKEAKDKTREWKGSLKDKDFTYYDRIINGL